MEFKILRNTCDYRSWEYLAVLANASSIQHDSVRIEMGVVANNYIFFHNGKGVDNDSFANLCIGMYDR